MSDNDTAEMTEQQMDNAAAASVSNGELIWLPHEQAAS